METLDYLYYFGVLAALIIVMYIILAIFKKITQNKSRSTAQGANIFDTKSSSLFIQEVLPIDQKNKIIILGRDNLRHVILLGENHSNLIETVTPEQLENTHNLSGTPLNKATLTAPVMVNEPPEPDLGNITPEEITDEPVLPTPSKDSPNAKPEQDGPSIEEAENKA